MKETLKAIGWTTAEAARRADVPLRTMERWAASLGLPPVEIEDWLDRVRLAVESVPPPPPPTEWQSRMGRPPRSRQ